MAVDADGYWIVDGRIKDAAGNDVKATGSNGKDGDSFFKSVSDGDDAVTFTLTDGTEIVIPKTSVSSFCFVQPDDGRSYFVFDFGKKKDADAEYDGCGNRRLHEYSRRVEGVAEPCEK